MSFLDRFLTPKNKLSADSAYEKYLNHFTNVFGKEPLCYRNESLSENIEGVSSLVFKDCPEPDYITALTYGLSLIDRPEWQDTRVELCICTKSGSLDWAQVMGYIANKMRGGFSFSYGQTISFGQPISNDSEMDAFLIFAPAIFEEQEYQDLAFSTDYKISIAQLYPVYSSEIETIKSIGIERFWNHPDFDPFDVKRPPINKETVK